jgi:hypothetical protein
MQYLTLIGYLQFDSIGATKVIGVCQLESMTRQRKPAFPFWNISGQLL